MASCNKCDNFDDWEIDNIAESDEHEQQLLNSPDYQPDLYYYWHGDIQEDYQMPKGYECLCECCFGDLLGEGKIIEKYEWKTNKLNPKWNDDTMGWFMPI